MTPAARLAAAIELLEEIAARPRRPADATANDFFRARRYIGSGDRRAVSERAWRVLRAFRRLEWWTQQLGAAPSPRLLVMFSLVLEGWAPSGVVQSFSGGNFAPSPLISEEKQFLAQLEGHTLDHPQMPRAVRLEVPEWILPHLDQRFGEALQAEMAAMAESAPLDLRVNILKTTRDQACAALQAEKIPTEPTPLSPWGLRAPTRISVTSGAAFQTGLVEIQDEGSQLVAMLVDAQPEMRVVDWCAGAGGKTLAIAAMMANRGSIVACDVSAPRLEGAVRRLRRAGVHNVERHLTVTGDKWAKRRAGSFDRVLVDAPCTGVGTWRRNPDARLRLQEQDLLELLPKQAAILEAASRLVKPGGRLIYATCSVLSAENEDQIARFLSHHPDFEVMDIAQIDPLPQSLKGSGPYITLTPRQHGTDGFFGAVLKRLPSADAAHPVENDLS